MAEIRLPVNTIANYDPEIIPLLGAPPGSSFERRNNERPLVPCDGTELPDPEAGKRWPPPGVPVIQVAQIRAIRKVSNGQHDGYDRENEGLKMRIPYLLVGLTLLATCGKVEDGIVDAGVAHTVTTTRSGNGNGTVTSTPAGIDCGGDCSEAFAEGTDVTLRAAAGGDSAFVGWSGAGCGGTGDCIVDVTGDLTIEATFALKNSVVVTLAGNGVGMVTSSPAGIDCPGDCSEAYPPGQTVTLSATTGAASTFTGWSGSGCTGTAPCIVSTDMAVAVVATFALEQHTLTVAKAGNGSGTVTSNPSGIACGGTCSASYDSGTTVTLMAAAAVGSTFTGWSGGGCSGTGTCTVSMTAAMSVTATFVISFSCTLVTNVLGCTDGAIAEINLGPLSSTICRSQCQSAMPAAGMTSGCWVVATNLNCYCRSGSIVTGGVRPGGTCN